MRSASPVGKRKVKRQYKKLQMYNPNCSVLTAEAASLRFFLEKNARAKLRLLGKDSESPATMDQIRASLQRLCFSIGFVEMFSETTEETKEH